MKSRVIYLIAAIVVSFFVGSACGDVDPNLVGWWRMDGPVGGDANLVQDYSGNGYDLVKSDNIRWVDGGGLAFWEESSDGLYFADEIVGTDSSAMATDLFSSVDREVTISFWINSGWYSNMFSASQTVLSALSNYSRTSVGIELPTDSKALRFAAGAGRDQIYIYNIYDAFEGDNKNQNFLPMFGDETLIVFTKDIDAGEVDPGTGKPTGEMRLYVNGQLKSLITEWSGSNVTQGMSGITVMRIGSLLGEGLVNGTVLRDLKIYSRALSDVEISRFYYPCDLNSDYVVDFEDIKIMADKWLDGIALAQADINLDDLVNLEDYVTVANSFGDKIDHDLEPWEAHCTVERGIPEPLADHPGNIYLAGSDVFVDIPSEASAAVSWAIADDTYQVVSSGAMPSGAEIDAGTLGIGWYWVSFLDGAGQEIWHTTASVIARLQAPIPQDSPVCLDTASAEFEYHVDPEIMEDAMNDYASLAALAGVNIVRDRLKWRIFEPSQGVFPADTRYDMSADIQSEWGLKVLQVFHNTPSWARVYPEPLPIDLRHPYRSCKEMATNFKGTVQAWEPWNEANITPFGAQVIDETTSYQKAAYLGFKAGDPDVVVGWNPYTGDVSALQKYGLMKNETWSYYDTMNWHAYEDFDLGWETLVEVACGKPVWITEADKRMPPATGAPWYDLSPEYEILKASYIVQTYANSMSLGVNRFFHFILGHFDTSDVQHSLLRLDKTPRAGYSALAAVGRFLAGAEYIGKYTEPDNKALHVMAFKGEPDGVESEVIVAWAEEFQDWATMGNSVEDWPLGDGLNVRGVYDYLGRYLGTEIPAQLIGKPIFVVLEPGSLDGVDLEQAWYAADRIDQPCDIVLQMVTPSSLEASVPGESSSSYEHLIDPGVPTVLDFYVYNFGDTTVSGDVVVSEIGSGCSFTPTSWNVTIEPMGREHFTATVTIPDKSSMDDDENWFTLRGEFGFGTEPVLAFRLYDTP